MKYTPKGNRNIVVIFSATLLLLSVIFLVFSYISGDFSSKILIILSIAFFMLSMLIASRYLSLSYTYVADDFELIITKNTPKTSITVCRLYYTDIISIVKTKNFSKTNNQNYKEYYNYCQSLFCQNSYTVLYNSGGEYGIFVFEPNQYFLNLLEKYTKNDIIVL